MDVSKNSGTPKSSILIEFSIINHPFWGTTILGNPHVLPPSFFNHLFALACSPKNGQKLNFKSSPSPSTTFTGLNLNDLDDQVQVRLVKGILETKHVSATRNRNRFLKDSIEILVVKNRDSWFHGLWYNKPHNWVGFHPLYTLKTIRGPLFHCSCDHRVSLPVNHVRFLNQNLPVCLKRCCTCPFKRKSGPWQDEKKIGRMFVGIFVNLFTTSRGFFLTYKLTVWRL